MHLTIYAVSVLLSMILYAVVGVYVGRKYKGLENFFVVGRNAPTFFIVGSLIASYMSTSAYMGEIGFSYRGYMVIYMAMIVVANLGYVFGANYFGRYIRRTEVLTLPEYFGTRFGSKRLRILAGIVTVIGLSCYLIAVTQGCALLVQKITGVSYAAGIFIILLSYALFIIYTGSAGTLFVETIMFIVFAVMSIIVVPSIINAAGGFPDAIIQAAMSDYKPDMYSWHGPHSGASPAYTNNVQSFNFIVKYGIVWLAVLAVSPWQTSRYLMAKDEHRVIRSGMLAPIAACAVLIFLNVAIVTVNNVNPDISPVEYAFLGFSIDYLPTWIGIVVCCGIMAAGISSCCTFVTLVACSVTNDILPLCLKNFKTKVSNTRVTMAIFAIVTAIATYYQPPAVMWICYFAATWLAVSWLYVGFASVWSRKLTENGAFWAMLTGMVVFAVLSTISYFGWMTYNDWFIPEVAAIVCSIIAAWIGTAAHKDKSEQEIRYFQLMHEAPKELYEDKTAWKKTMRYPFIGAAGCTLIAVILVFYYYLPVREAFSQMGIL